MPVVGLLMRSCPHAIRCQGGLGLFWWWSFLTVAVQMPYSILCTAVGQAHSHAKPCPFGAFSLLLDCMLAQGVRVCDRGARRRIVCTSGVCLLHTRMNAVCAAFLLVKPPVTSEAVATRLPFRIGCGYGARHVLRVDGGQVGC